MYHAALKNYSRKSWHLESETLMRLFTLKLLLIYGKFWVCIPSRHKTHQPSKQTTVLRWNWRGIDVAKSRRVCTVHTFSALCVL